ncbi:hypothetical protein [Sphingomonas sp. JC676]|nr:hypothetical protein [Sphingomonas sp. JC676]
MAKSICLTKKEWGELADVNDKGHAAMRNRRPNNISRDGLVIV